VALKKVNGTSVFRIGLRFRNQVLPLKEGEKKKEKGRRSKRSLYTGGDRT
jgi:hypothetical protein